MASNLFDGLDTIDLSYPLSSTSIFWPNGEGFALCLDCSTSPEGLFYSAGTFTCAEHCGTHVDAPFHFASHGATVDLLPLTSLLAPLFIIDISVACATNPNYELLPQDIFRYEQQYGLLPAGCIVVIRTGWGKYYEQGTKAYLGFDATTDGPYSIETSQLSFPGIGTEAAGLLVTRRVAGVGLDTASLDHGPSKTFSTHRILLGAGIYGIENISSTIDVVPEYGAHLMVMPLKIEGGSGAPSRVVALVPKPTS